MSHLVRDEETYTAHPVSSDECHSLSSLSDHTLSPPTDRPAVVVTSSGGVASVERGVEEEEGEGEATARKQWANEEVSVHCKRGTSGGLKNSSKAQNSHKFH